MSRYDAFVSYSHGQDQALAQALQSELQRFARPWYRPRALRVFRDQTDLSASPGLWSSIEQALKESSWFILMASPASAKSHWVQQEVQWWLTHRHADRILIALTIGEIRWAGRDFDWSRTDAIPEQLSGAFRGEPLWIDLRKLRPAASEDTDSAPHLGDIVADLAAPIHGRDKDTLVGEHVRYQRRTRRLVRTVVASLSALLVAVSITAYVANDQRNKAVTQARIATARLLATESGALLNTNLDVTELLAVAAYRTDNDPQTRAALFAAATASPALVRYMPAGGQVSAIAGSDSGQVAVAGTTDGRIMRWEPLTGPGRPLARLSRAVTSIATSADGATIAATDGTDALVWSHGSVTQSIRGAQSVAVSPSGRYLAAVSESGRVSLIDRLTDHVTTAAADVQAVTVAMPTDNGLVAVGSGGSWTRLTIPHLNVTMASGANMGVHGFLLTASARGGFIGFTNGGPSIPLWQTTQPAPDSGASDLVAASHGTDPEAISISEDGTRVAVADAGTIYVSRTSQAPKTDWALSQTIPTDSTVATLTGNSSTLPGGLIFLGDDTHLLSASGDSLILWDLNQLTRISRHTNMSVPFACSACPPPTVSVRPDEQQVAVLTGNNMQVIIHGLGPRRDQTVISGDQYGLLGWSPNSSRLFLATLIDRRIVVRETGSGTGAPVVGRWPPVAQGYYAIALSRDHRRLITVNDNGAVQVRDLATQRLERTVPGPATSNAGSPVGQVEADPTGSFVAETIYMRSATSVRLIDTATGMVRSVGAGNVEHATFSGQHLLIQRSSGQFEVWNLAGTTLQWSLHQDSSYLPNAIAVTTAPTIVGSLLIQRRSDSTLSVTDLATGNAVGSLALPAAYTDFKTGLAATPDGRQLVTVTETSNPLVDSDGLLVQWDLSVDAWIRTACTSAGRNLTSSDWRHYVGTAAPSDLTCMH
jgi:WD40 repeat protein